MPDARTISFSKSARDKIPASLIDEIRNRNFLDLALHARALEILEENRKQWSAANLLETLPSPPEPQGKKLGMQRAWTIPKPETQGGWVK